MKKMFAFSAAFIVGTVFILLWMGSVPDIALPFQSSSPLALTDGSFSGTHDVVVKSSGAEAFAVTAVGEDPWVSFSVEKAKYLDIFFESFDITPDGGEHDGELQLYYDNGGGFSEEVSDFVKIRQGRNLIKLREQPANQADGSAVLRFDFPAVADASYNIAYFNLTEHLPFRIRHAVCLGAAEVLLAVACWFSFCKKGGALAVRLGAFKKYSYLLANLVKKDFTTKYRRSVLGVLWSVLNPLLMAAVMSVVFSSIMRVQVPNFAVFYLCGSLVFGLMGEATNGSLGAVLGAAGLIKKVYIPKYIFPLEKCFFALVNSLFSLAALFILMPFLGVPLKVTNLLFFVPLLYTLAFSAGLGMVLAAVNVFFRDIGHLYGIWITAWMYLTPVIYPPEMIPASLGAVMRLNPMYYYVDYFRQVMMYNTLPSLRTNLICLAYAAGFLICGAAVFKLKQDRFILFI